MYCWKNINIHKEYGLSRLYFISAMITLIVFSIMFVPLSAIHPSDSAPESGIVYLAIAIVLLPGIHSFMHLLPLIIMHKQTKLAFGTTHKFFPIIHYVTKKYMSKRNFLTVAIAPTICITVPGIIASYVISDYYVYILLFTSLHIGVTLQDFIYIIRLTKAPKESYIENEHAGLNILIRS